MIRSKDMKNQIMKGLLLGAFSLVAGSAVALTDFHLIAKEFQQPMPDGSTVTMWGYAEDTGGACYSTTPASARRSSPDCLTPIASAPGPRFKVPVGDQDVRLRLTNLLPEPTSLVIPGQKMPFSATDNGPTWNDGSTGGRASATQRVRSFGREAAANGGRRSYVWRASRNTEFARPGSFIYHSGTHPQKQVYMGLYGAVTRDSGVGEAYPALGTSQAVTYDNEVILFYSDIDPDLNAAVVNGTYQTSIHYHARWFLVNGKPYSTDCIDDGTGSDIVSGYPCANMEQTLPVPAGAAGETTLLRFLSTASETHVPVLQGMHMTIHAEDGNPYTWQNGPTVADTAPREQYSVMLPPLKTKDATIAPQIDGSYAVYDGNGYMTNPTDPNDFDHTDPIGGMLRFLSVGGVDTDGDGFLDGVDNCPLIANTDQTDGDGDGIGDACDNCPAMSNVDQLDKDGNGIGDACETPVDSDGDGIADSIDNCPLIANPGQEDADGDGIGDVCDSLTDSDGDGIADSIDNCPLTANPGQEDADGDGIGDACELDTDGDGVIDDNDICPGTPAGEAVDANGCSGSQISFAPVATDNAYNIGEAGILSGNVITDDTGSGSDSDANGDTLTATLVGTAPANAAMFSLNPDGSFTYKSNPDFNGTNSFIYEVSDGNGGTDQATVTIIVTVVNDVPVANDDLFYLNSMETTTIALPGVLANDTDPDGNPLTAQNGVVSKGTLGLNSNGSFTYLPEEGINNIALGTLATFTYEANDGITSSAPATVTLNRTLTVVQAVCERRNNGRCDWRIEGTKSNTGNVRVRAFDSVTGQRIGTVRTTGQAWLISVDNSRRNRVLNPIDVRVLGDNTARILAFPVTEQ